MSLDLIHDYLNTQGLRINPDEVRISQLALRAVIERGQAAIERSVLWYSQDDMQLDQHLENNEDNDACLKQIFMALDSACERTRPQSAAVYLKPAEPVSLVRLSQQGSAIEALLPLDEAAAIRHLASRSAQTGWLNQADDVAYWLSLDEMQGEHNLRAGSQISLPIHLSNGQVLGVVHAEYSQANAIDEAALAEWVALALVLTEPMRTLAGITDADEEKEH